MQPGGHQEALELGRDGAEHQSAPDPAGPAVGAHDHAQTGGVPELQPAEVEHEVAEAAVDGLVQPRPRVGGGTHVEAAFEGQRHVVAGDAHALLLRGAGPACRGGPGSAPVLAVGAAGCRWPGGSRWVRVPPAVPGRGR